MKPIGRDRMICRQMANEQRAIALERSRKYNEEHGICFYNMNCTVEDDARSYAVGSMKRVLSRKRRKYDV